tara:strand:+ start:3243 stop:3941 length:699 start_codon:yes stop_codon:yes gene_type:complete
LKQEELFSSLEVGFIRKSELSAGDYSVTVATRLDCVPFIMGIHYARRWPSISHAFALRRGGLIVGVVTYGVPFSSTLRNGIAGEGLADSVLELNRLCLLDNLPNEASRLVSASLKLLPSKKIIVSFADTEQNHIGTVYQACNFSYHGLSAAFKDYAVRGLEHMHHSSIEDSVGRYDKDPSLNKKAALIARYGDRLYMKERARKHRYVYLCGPKMWRKRTRKHINYAQQPYPK